MGHFPLTKCLHQQYVPTVLVKALEPTFAFGTPRALQGAKNEYNFPIQNIANIGSNDFTRTVEQFRIQLTLQSHLKRSWSRALEKEKKIK